MTDIALTWSNFKNIVSTKALLVQYSEDFDTYYIFAYDGDIQYTVTILKDTTQTGKVNPIGVDATQEKANQTDFESNYKDTANSPLLHRDDFGDIIFAPTLDDSKGLTPKKKSYKLIVNLNQTNFFDIEVTTERRICGGEYWIRVNGTDYTHKDDYVEFSVIDKNDILGYFQYYGLSNATGSNDFLELSKFIINDYVRVGKTDDGYYKQCYEGIKGTSLVYAGLFFRIMFDSHYIPQTGDSQTLELVARIYYYE